MNPPTTSSEQGSVSLATKIHRSQAPVFAFVFVVYLNLLRAYFHPLPADIIDVKLSFMLVLVFASLKKTNQG